MKRSAIAGGLIARLTESRDLCRQALDEPEVRAASELIERSASPPNSIAVDVLAGLAARNPAVGRALLLRCAVEMLDRLPETPVEESVAWLMCKSADSIAAMPAAESDRFVLTNQWFQTQYRIVRGLRFPAGQHQWELSGFPRSWLPRVPLAQLPKVLDFLIREARGFHPYFETHLAPPAEGVSVLLEREFLAAFFRMARSLEKQPQVKAIMAVSWMHSPETHRVTPHLAFMNRPFLEAGGLVTSIGPASAEDGFLEGSARREELYRSGQYRPTTGVALCSRARAIAWADAHPEAGDLARNLI